jgi:hypothetical protein
MVSPIVVISWFKVGHDLASLNTRSYSQNNYENKFLLLFLLLKFNDLI